MNDVATEELHGTYGSYQRELKSGHEPCAACKKAAADYHRDWRKRGGDAVAHERWLTDTRNLALERMAKTYPAEFWEVLAQIRRECGPDSSGGAA